MKHSKCADVLYAIENALDIGVFCGKCAKYFRNSAECDAHVCSGKPDPRDLIKMGRIEARMEYEHKFTR